MSRREAFRIRWMNGASAFALSFFFLMPIYGLIEIVLQKLGPAIQGESGTVVDHAFDPTALRIVAYLTLGPILISILTHLRVQGWARPSGSPLWLWLQGWKVGLTCLLLLLPGVLPLQALSRWNSAGVQGGGSFVPGAALLLLLVSALPLWTLAFLRWLSRTPLRHPIWTEFVELLHPPAKSKYIPALDSAATDAGRGAT